MIKIESYSLQGCKTSFWQLWVNEVIVFKNFELLVKLFQIDDPINEMLF